MQSLVSIIIPIYNLEKYIEKCLQSVLNQTYQNTEILLIDDGSSDSSGSICDQYAMKDPRVVAIHQLNGGVSVARNHGIDLAHGKYICFVDGDDWLPLNAVEKLVEGIEKNQTDYCCGNMFTISAKGTHLLKYFPNDLVNFKRKETKAVIQYYSSEIFGPMRRLYKTDIIKAKCLRFPIGVKLGEDEIFVLSYLGQCDSYTFIPDAVYFYNGLTENSAVKKLYTDIVKWHYKMANYWLNLFDSLDDEAAVLSIEKRYLYHWFIANCDILRLKNEGYYSREKMIEELEFNFSLYEAHIDLCRLKDIPYLDLFRAFAETHDSKPLIAVLEKEVNRPKWKPFLIKWMSRIKRYLIYQFDMGYRKVK